MIRILTDSTADFTNEELEALHITRLPLTIHFGQETYFDGVDMDAPAFYQKLAHTASLPTTSQVPPDRFAQALRPIVAQGDEALLFTLSSSLSATYQSAMLAAQDIGPERIRVVDTKTASLGAQLIIRHAVKRMAEGADDLEALYREMAGLSERVRIFAAVDTLKYLKMGGRLSSAGALIGTVLGIKPLIRVSRGKVESCGKVRGEKAACKALTDTLAAADIDERYGIAFAHSACADRLAAFRADLPDRLKAIPAFTCEMGPVIGTHVGPGAVVACFIERAER